MGGVMKSNTPDLLKKLSQMQEADIMCDLVIRLQDDIDFHVHRLLFCALSTMIMETCAALPPDHVNDPTAPWVLDFTGTGLSVETVSNIVHYVYGRTMDIQEKEKIQALKQAADILGMPILVKFCEQQDRVAKVPENKVLNMKDILAKKMATSPLPSAKRPWKEMELDTDKQDIPYFEELPSSGASKVPKTKKNKCPECNIYFKSSGQHIEHMKKHKKKSICPTCGQVFARREWLDEHLPMCGRSSRPYKCTKCKRYFRKMTTLKNHIKQEHKDISDNDNDAEIGETSVAEKQAPKKCLQTTSQKHSTGHVIVCENDNNEWPLSSYTVYLRNFDRANVSTKPPNKPKGGDIYVFSKTQMPYLEWRKDGYDWKKKKNKTQTQTLTGDIFHIKAYGDDGLPLRTGSRIFQKFEYSLLKDETLVLVHYIGDDKGLDDKSFRNPTAPNHTDSVPLSTLKKEKPNESSSLNLLGDHTFAAPPRDSTSAKDTDVQPTDNAVESDDEAPTVDETAVASDNDSHTDATAKDNATTVAAGDTTVAAGDNTVETDEDGNKDQTVVAAEVENENIIIQAGCTPFKFKPVDRGNGVILIGDYNRMMTTKEYAYFLRSIDHSFISMQPPTKPRAGEMYVYNRNYIHDKDWRCDGYNWINTGLKCKTFVRKHQFNIKTVGSDGLPFKNGSSAFRRLEYTLVTDDTLILVHYVGDESVYVPMAHGNCRKSIVFEHQRTKPSVIHKIQTMTANNPAKDVFSVLSSSSGADPLPQITVEPELARPRSLKQVQNHKYTLRKQERDRKAAKNLVQIMQTEDSSAAVDGSPNVECIVEYSQNQTAQQPFIVFSNPSME